MEYAAKPIDEVKCHDRTGDHVYKLIPLNLFGYGDLSIRRIAQLWLKMSQFDVLFSDYTRGEMEPFVLLYMDPRGIWIDMVREDGESIGLCYFTEVFANFDAKGHFTFWDKIAAGREPIVWAAGKWMMEAFNLHRLTAQVPPYQAGTIRFVKRLGFKEEGEIREAVTYHDRWFPLISFGLLREELQEKLKEVGNGFESVRGTDLGDASGDTRGDVRAGEVLSESDR